MGVFISKVTPGQLADQSGVVAVGQRLLSVNGSELQDLGPKKTKGAAVALMRERRSAGLPLVITIVVEPSPSAAKDSAPLSPGECKFHSCCFLSFRFQRHIVTSYRLPDALVRYYVHRVVLMLLPLNLRVVLAVVRRVDFCL